MTALGRKRTDKGLYEQLLQLSLLVSPNQRIDVPPREPAPVLLHPAERIPGLSCIDEVVPDHLLDKPESPHHFYPFLSAACRRLASPVNSEQLMLTASARARQSYRPTRLYADGSPSLN